MAQKLAFSPTARTLLKRYIELDTSRADGKNYPAALALLDRFLTRLDFKATLVSMPKKITTQPHRQHLVARKIVDKTLPTVLIYNHIDVVPAAYDQAFRFSMTSTKLFGRGACDHKGSTVAVLSALEKLKKVPLRFNIIFIATTDEETNQIEQLRYLATTLSLPKDTLVFDPDTYAGGVCVAELGFIQWEIVVDGQAAHSGSSHLGINAIEHAAAVVDFLTLQVKPRMEKQISKFKSFPSTGIKYMCSRCNVNQISGGTAANVIPDQCMVMVDLRFIPEMNMKLEFKQLTKDLNTFAKSNHIKLHTRIVSQCDSYACEHPEIEILNQIYDDISGEGGIYGALGSTHAAQWCKELRLPHFGIGVARGDTHMHGLNEFAYIKDLNQLQQTVMAYFSAKRN